MTNLNIFESTFAKPKLNCFANCRTQIKHLPFWINNKPFWTYECKCCFTYRFEAGETFKGDFYDL